MQSFTPPPTWLHSGTGETASLATILCGRPCDLLMTMPSNNREVVLRRLRETVGAVESHLWTELGLVARLGVRYALWAVLVFLHPVGRLPQHPVIRGRPLLRRLPILPLRVLHKSIGCWHNVCPHIVGHSV